MRNYEPNPFESVQVVYLLKSRMADKGAGKLAPHAPAGGAAAGLVSVSTTCTNSFSEGNHLRRGVQCRLRLHALQQIAGLLQTGFSAACGSTNINSLQVYPPLSNTGGKLPNYR